VLAEIVAAAPAGPIHIHIAEQLREVQECLAHTGRRPVDWLLDRAPVDGRWCLVHATHVTPEEISRMARAGAIVGLCPTTEANLGDGVFPAAAFIAARGRFGVGSDSHVSVSPVEELRWLEYGQRLTLGRRTVLAGGPDRSTGRALLAAALDGGTAACGSDAGRIGVGLRADLVVLDTKHPLLVGRSGDPLLDSWIFSGNSPLVRHVVVAGNVVVRDGHHRHEEDAGTAFAAAVQALVAASS
jgi:formimidoylglutamate deiminase